MKGAVDTPFLLATLDAVTSLTDHHMKNRVADPLSFERKRVQARALMGSLLEKVDDVTAERQRDPEFVKRAHCQHLVSC